MTGNANVILIQGNTEGVNADDEIQAGSNSIQQKGYTLYINSTDKSTIYVHLKDLQRIDAAETATIKTRGSLTWLYFRSS
ncbi:hypothetical protein H9X96_00305 [Pedobacter sp. N36a]|uniref:hypothetical protein n=1 Tax=Pedobacter sp. N36a TaxID=2767996 RepID=UPI001656C290|nr:hypothetical protein [Pedobacter sp. N36a]MBC8984210.1 hypothetical protein [Pedobacter sp. N36a]